ncbi:hypothetical protein F0U61_00620 [Archangium violaceum]|uniref:SitA5 family polymorphic toxin n=1 Tax=Archangium violaceum TaxID=83451 RepID=UPI002B2CBBE5|nr:hypothetical protein F0U61_00620 [Archangium violaceum]
MSIPVVDSRPVGERWCSRVGALALAALMLLTACATGAHTGGRRMTEGSSPPRESLDTGDAVLASLPTDFAPVRVGDSEFTAVLSSLVLEVPLRVAARRAPLYVGRPLALASAPLGGEAGLSDLVRSYGRYCERRGTPGDCLTLLEDSPLLGDDDKRDIALALAVGPALEGVDAEVRAMLDPTRVLATVSLAITTYMALVLAPEAISKGAAIAFTVLLWGYLGWEFLDLLQAYARLYEDAPRASTFAELREVGERFGQVIGPNSVRILVMVGTAAVGGTGSLMSRAPKLPGFGQASRMVEAATGAERVIVSVPEGTIRVVLAPHVVAMAARSGKLLPSGHRAWGSYSSFRRAMGAAGQGKEWHHIVEQTPGNVKRFGGEALHNTENVVAMDKALHGKVSSFYSSIRVAITKSTKLTVRQWLGTQSYEAQREFGLLAIENVRKGIW